MAVANDHPVAAFWQKVMMKKWMANRHWRYKFPIMVMIRKLLMMTLIMMTNGDGDDKWDSLQVVAKFW